MTNKVEIVRGMNASLASDQTVPSKALTERDPPKFHITHRQIALACLLTVLGVLAAIYTVDAVTSSEQTFPAVITASKVYDLNFPNTGLVTSLAITPGQRITAGQVLAQQDSAPLQAQVAADSAVVAADKLSVSQAQAPQIGAAQLEQDTLQVEQAEATLTSAQSNLDAAEATGHASVAAAEQAAGADAQLVTSDAARYKQVCPNGPVETPSSGGSAKTSATTCENLQLQLDKDSATEMQAQAQVPMVEAQAQQTAISAQGTVNTAQAALNIAENQKQVQSYGSVPAIAQAEANLSVAESQLNEAKLAMAQATLVAPDNGTVSEVYGAAGEYIGPDGVHQYQPPAALPTSKSPSFQLFPSSPNGSGTQSNTSGSEPMIELISGQQQATAQITESQVSHFTIGHKATISISAANITSPAVVTEVVLEPSRVSSTVTYDVILTLDHPEPGLLPGMSAVVR